ncbi:putative E3 ubiquitin-protein ligase UBR7 [Paratrimastix pyriformis]|uniref:E3 ubiquitin-protein ligase UBR7 n=1 Tax=Paratrimastix pyriformis TaxID=342808 RepID=A0ABQ8UAU2_9EUKA|nr:putative E3 ubiquitin-protein ligase UBR7 [Paratrimastix pyriformis]
MEPSMRSPAARLLHLSPDPFSSPVVDLYFAPQDELLWLLPERGNAPYLYNIASGRTVNCDHHPTADAAPSLDDLLRPQFNCALAPCGCSQGPCWGQANTIRMYDPVGASSTVIANLTPAACQVRAIQSPDPDQPSPLLVVASTAGLHLCDARKGYISTVAVPHGALTMKYSPDHSQLAVRTGMGEMWLFEAGQLRSGRRLPREHNLRWGGPLERQAPGEAALPLVPANLHLPHMSTCPRHDTRPRGPDQRGGICAYCARRCHPGHEVVSIGTRPYCCECGTARCPCVCTGAPAKVAAECNRGLSMRHHNFADRYCLCDRPDDGLCMIQCWGCAEWFHATCIGVALSDERPAIMSGTYLCGHCLTAPTLAFLTRYRFVDYVAPPPRRPDDDEAEAEDPGDVDDGHEPAATFPRTQPPPPVGQPDGRCLLEDPDSPPPCMGLRLAHGLMLSPDYASLLCPCPRCASALAIWAALHEIHEQPPAVSHPQRPATAAPPPSQAGDDGGGGEEDPPISSSSAMIGFLRGIMQVLSAQTTRRVWTADDVHAAIAQVQMLAPQQRDQLISRREHEEQDGGQDGDKRS